MSTNIILLIALILIPPTNAREIKFKGRVLPARLQTELKAAGIQITQLACLADDCKISMPDSEKKDPMPIIKAHKYADPRQMLRTRRARALALTEKLSAGAIAPEEKDELLKLLSMLLLGIE